ncbi:non-structural maintenance of chromosomes element 3 homolog isoform X1 [Frieseomelitta varia]|uniref:non-structural maintenance of chromosomes element 3 homolog isoform X1 n=2 Tax=Frieseomelitta varia TaxID=561572 RepID=UPI001CB683C1|nr:non-structural maintenance of chromosomes element 3 homolog isoform X1 [Frieseomelitta varia]
MSSQNGWRNQMQNNLSQPIVRGRNAKDVVYYSQPSSSSSSLSQNSSLDHATSKENDQLVNSLIRYLLMLDEGKQIISKARIIKNVFGNRGKHFAQTMNKVKNLLSTVFGYQLIELESGKYMLVNEIENTLPHIEPSATESSQMILLFLVLTHIFMLEDCCSEESLWSFLTNLGIPCEDDQQHSYFGNVKQLINEIFVAQGYLNKIVLETNDSTNVEYKWGYRAEYEFSRRTALEFVSQVYDGRPINSWQLQFKTLIAREAAANK